MSKRNSNIFYRSFSHVFLFGIFFFSQASYSNSESAEVIHGERLFLENRFSESFYQFVQRGGNYNTIIDKGDPQLNKTFRFFGLPPYQIPFATSPFKGSTFSCRTCHMVDEHISQKELGMRAYSDFASRSPLSLRSDMQTVTVRNSPILVSTNIDQDDILFHYDGEFSTLVDLILATLTGRNLGWLPGEYEVAKNHICNVIKNDNGKDQLASEFGALSYREILSGKNTQNEILPDEYLIDEKYRVDINHSTCEEILVKIAYLLEEYVFDLQFTKDATAISPYDAFLKLNNLPEHPNPSESANEYSHRLLSSIINLEKNNELEFIEKDEFNDSKTFRFHNQLYKFGEEELDGMKIFFNQSSDSKISKGNCIACHPSPHFTDFKFHNIGVTQVEYEEIHGPNSFNRLPVPNYEARTINANKYLPATYSHPVRLGIFRKKANQNQPLYTDLGAWNIFFNDDFPKPQSKLYRMFCDDKDSCETKDIALERSLASFKTPTLRDLGHSAPYMHNGQISDLHAVVGFYMNASIRSRSGQVRNSDKELQDINITVADINPLVLFLISLYEDYH